ARLVHHGGFATCAYSTERVSIIRGIERKPDGMSETITLPELGESVTEGTVTRWLKEVGDTIEVDEPIVEISTDKVETDIPSPVAGTVLEILVQEDEKIEVGQALAVIGDVGESAYYSPTVDAVAEVSTEETAVQVPAEHTTVQENRGRSGVPE